jgi:hypothetical protein
MNRTQFEWQADEGEKLDSSSQLPETTRENRRRFVLAFFLVLIITSGLTYWSLSRRQRQLEENVRQDVKVSFDLWHEAVERKDSELYTQLLAAEDGSWRRNQERLFEKDLILGRSFLGLSMQNEATTAPNIELAPDWQQATVSFEQSYAAAPASDFNGMVRLQHTVVYEIQDSSWLQAAPDETFWGEWQTEEGELLTVRYPARDAGLVQRISRQLEADLQAVCSERNEHNMGTNDLCTRVKPLFLKLGTEADSLDALDAATGPMLYGRVYQLPAPTLVGLPVDELSYHAFYQGYTRKLVENIRTAVNPPLPLPQQVIRTLCFNHPDVGPKLYKYDPALGMWEAELPDRSFRFLEPLPMGQGLILAEIGDLESWHSRLIHWNEGSEELLLDEATDEVPYRVINPINDVDSYLLLRRMVDNQSSYLYSSLNLRSCNETGCDLAELPGYALWSSAGQHTLLQIGSEIYLGDADGRIHSILGTGFNPFWLDDETVAYIQFSEQSLGSINKLVMNQIAPMGEQIVFDTNDLAEAAGINEDELLIRYVTLNPADPNLLLVHASGLYDYAGEYFIFTVRLPVDRKDDSDPAILFQLQREGSPGGDIGQVTQTGYLPFSPSPDGRWLMVSELTGYDSATRTFLLHDLHLNQTEIISEGDPVFPAQFPSYDWSDDGRWLVITGDGFFRLIAPEYDYEQLVPHDFDYCTFTRWSD